MNPAKLVEKAKTSSFSLWLLNRAFERMVPFNKPHGFEILKIADGFVRTRLPYKRRNLNHLKGLHACALATLTEITSGFILAMTLDPAKFRLILKKLEVDYLYQGKTDAFGEYQITGEWMNDHILIPLKSMESVEIISEVKIVDKKGNQLTNGKAYWQIKDWSKVKTKT
jgi:acyl-coenzyme A thioesterase PaaI-like protein